MSILQRAVEGPAGTLMYPDDDFFEGITGAKRSHSGIRVTEKTALGYAPVWRAVNLVSGDVAKLPLLVYEREGEGKKRSVKHPAYKLLKTRPNEYMNFFNFKKYIQSNASLKGNGYAAIERRGDGSPSALLPLPTESVTPVRKDGKLWYIVTVNANIAKLRPENVLHIRGLGDLLSGFPVLALARESLGLGIAARNYGARFFSNDAHPGFVLEHPGTLSDTALEHLRTEWNKIHMGLTKAHRLSILEEGMKVSTTGMDHDKAQFLGTREFEIREVANWIMVPPHKIGDTTKASYNSLEQENQSYLDNGLDPWLVNWEAECSQKLLTGPQKDRDTHMVEFVRGALVRADLQKRGLYYKTAIGNGWMNQDEVRARENMNPLPNGDGQHFWMPQNMAPITQSRDAHVKVLKDAVSRMVKRLNVHGEKARKKGELAEWLKTGIDTHRTIVEDALAPAVGAARAVGVLNKTTASVVDALYVYLRKQWSLIGDDSPEGFDKGEVEQMPQRITMELTRKEDGDG